jgi:hypothetical protein
VQPPFHISCSRHALPVSQPPDRRLAQESTALHCATRYNQPAAAERLMEKGADVNAKGEVHGAAIPSERLRLRLARPAPAPP